MVCHRNTLFKVKKRRDENEKTNDNTETFATLSAYPLSLISTDDGYLVAASGKSLLLGEDVIGTQQFLLLDTSGNEVGQFDAPQIMYLNGMVRLNSDLFLAADSLSGNIWQINPKTQEITSWVQDELLSPQVDQELFIPGANCRNDRRLLGKR